MKSVKKLTLCGIISALAVVLMLGTNIPIMLYTVPALTGILFIIPTFEFGPKWGILCFFVTSVLSFLLPTEREALVMFIGLFGFYPIVKILIERLRSRVIGALIKFAVFNISVTVCFAVIIKVLGLPVFETERFSPAIAVAIVYIVGNVTFLIFDITLTRIYNAYFIKLRKPLRKAMGIKK